MAWKSCGKNWNLFIFLTLLTFWWVLGVPSGFIGVKGKCFNVIIYMLYGVVFCLEVNAWIFLANILHLDLL